MFQLSELSDIDLAALVCDPTQLQTLLNFDPSMTVSVSRVSEELCGLGPGMVAYALEVVVQQLNVGELIKDVSRGGGEGC